MPDLAMPIFNQEPVTSLIGNMIFPNDPAEAMATASWILDGAILNSTLEQYHGIDESIVFGVRAAARGYSKEDTARAAYRGTQVGAIVDYLWRTPSASFEDAVRANIDLTSMHKLPGVRSSFYKIKTEFSKV